MSIIFFEYYESIFKSQVGISGMEIITIYVARYICINNYILVYKVKATRLQLR